MPLNTSLLPPPVEADFNALFAFDDKELVIDPNEEIVSGSFSRSQIEIFPKIFQTKSQRQKNDVVLNQSQKLMRRRVMLLKLLRTPPLFPLILAVLVERDSLLTIFHNHALVCAKREIRREKGWSSGKQL